MVKDKIFPFARQTFTWYIGLEVAKFVIEDIRDAEAPLAPTERVGWLSVDPEIPGSQGVPRNTPSPNLNIVSTKSIQQPESMGTNLLNDTLAALSHYSIIRSDKLQVDQDFCCKWIQCSMRLRWWHGCPVTQTISYPVTRWMQSPRSCTSLRIRTYPPHVVNVTTDELLFRAKWNSSLNDQGFKGIADFIKGHTCNSICKAMAFARRA